MPGHAHKALVVACVLTVAATPALPLTIQSRTIGDPVANAQVEIIALSGEIVSGDTERISQFAAITLQHRKIEGFFINSPGGDIFEAEKLADFFRKTGFVLAVPKGSYCASACFLVFSGARSKLFEARSYIGVHSVSHGSMDESITDLGFTTALARDAAEYGVPPAILGKLVTTPPDEVAWLTGDELVSMGATFVPDAPTPAGAPTAEYTSPSAKFVIPDPSPQQRVPPTVPTMSAAQQAASITPAYADGRQDRLTWEAWFNSLPAGPFKEGAMYWTSVRRSEKPSACAPPGVDVNWTAGCMAAYAKLVVSDGRRKSEPDYWWGWNSL